VFEDCLEGLSLGHRRVLARQFLDPVEREIELNLKRLLAAKRAVVVEDCYALGWRYELGASQLCHTRNKVEDRGFRRAVVPGGKRRIIDHALAPLARVRWRVQAQRFRVLCALCQFCRRRWAVASGHVAIVTWICVA
jgi:hypothetical protein